MTPHDARQKAAEARKAHDERARLLEFIRLTNTPAEER